MATELTWLGHSGCGFVLELPAARRCVSCHYGTFGLVTGTPDELPRLAPSEVVILAPAPGETAAL